MPNDADNTAPALDLPDPDLTYRNYLRTCEMLGVEQVSRGRAQDLMPQWTANLVAALEA